MLKMLIVEDERLEREGLQEFLNWSELGITVIKAACDGIDGLEMAEAYRPDIIITDIKMPGLDGIEMTRKIRSFMPEVKVIVLTGYDDFKYAKKAIDLKVDAYVLKPVEEDEMLEAVQKVVNECLTEREKIQEDISIKQKLNESFIIEKERFLWDLMQGKLQQKDIFTLKTKFDFGTDNGRYTMVAICLDSLSELEVEVDDSVAESIYLRIKDVLQSDKDYGIRQGNFVLYDEYKREIYLCIYISQMSNTSLQSMIENIKNQIVSNYEAKAVIGIGNEVKVLDKLSESYEAAQKALEYAMLWSFPMSNYDEVKRSREYFDKHIGEIILKGNHLSKQVIYAVNSANEDKILETIKDIFDFIRQSNSLEREFINNYVYSIINEVSVLLCKLNNSTEDIMKESIEIGRELSEFKSIDLIESYIVNFFKSVISLLSVKSSNKDERLIRKVIQLVENKYMNDINLSVIASEVFLSPNYLGSLFKKSTGKSFNDYLREYRIERAKELLRLPKNKVSDVAQRVGIGNLSYFSVVFKQVTGMSPGEFQEEFLRSQL